MSNSFMVILCLIVMEIEDRSVTSRKGIQGSLGFWIPRRKFEFQVLESRFFVSGIWIPDSNR